MKKIIVLMMLIISSVYGEAQDRLSVLDILEGKEYQVCRDYADNANEQYVNGIGWSNKFRIFNGKYKKTFNRPKWTKFKVSDSNLILLKRVSAYLLNINSKEKNQYSDDSIKYFDDYPVFYISKFDINSDGKNETLIRRFHDGYKPEEEGYSKFFIVSVVVINEIKNSVNVEKSKDVRQAFKNFKDIEPYNGNGTDTNVFLYNSKKYIDTLWLPTLSVQEAILIKILEIDKKEQKPICLFEYNPR